MTEPVGKRVQDLARVAALDIGDRRIGVAISDGLGLTAQPLLTYYRSSSGSGRKGEARRDAKSLLRLLRKAECRRIVVGLPLHLSGDAGRSAEKVRGFVEFLRAETELPIEFWDERLSTTAAHEVLDAAGHAVRGREAIIDQVAAVLILESYMTSKRHV